MAVPDSLPLENGRVGCVTCHDEQALDGHEARRGVGNPQLRFEAGVGALCTECHQSSESNRIQGHATGLRRAHLEKRSKKSAPASRPSLDSESQICLQCHDGTTAPDTVAHAEGRTLTEPGSDHPVGVAYDASRARERGLEASLVNEGKLSSRIRLFDGTVGCGSCHSVYSGTKDLLVMSNFKSGLCLACHLP